MRNDNIFTVLITLIILSSIPIGAWMMIQREQNLKDDKNILEANEGMVLGNRTKYINLSDDSYGIGTKPIPINNATMTVFYKNGTIQGECELLQYHIVLNKSKYVLFGCELK